MQNLAISRSYDREHVPFISVAARVTQKAAIVAMTCFIMISLTHISLVEADAESFARCVDACKNLGGGPIECFRRCAYHLDWTGGA